MCIRDRYAIDAPGGGGKVPVNPEYVESINDDEVVFRNYEGKLFRYPLKKAPGAPADGAIPFTEVPIVVY